jgi:hypothetical protein
MGRFLMLMMILGVTLAVAKKIEHTWQTGTLVRIMTKGTTNIPETSSDIHIEGGAVLMFRGTYQGQDGFWLAMLNHTQREPNVTVGKEYSYSVHCGFFDICITTTTPDRFGQVPPQPRNASKPTNLYLRDDDGRQSKLEMPEFHPAKRQIEGGISK